MAESVPGPTFSGAGAAALPGERQHVRLRLTDREGDHNLECARVDDVDSLRQSVVTYSRPFLGANVAQRGRTRRPKSTVATRLCLSTSMTEIVWPSVPDLPTPESPWIGT